MVSCSLRTAPSLPSFEWPDIVLPSSSSTNEVGECYSLWQDRVVASIAQIAAHDAWEKRVVENRGLSVVELVRRATIIETRFEECLRAVAKGEVGRAPERSSEGMQREWTERRKRGT